MVGPEKSAWAAASSWMTTLNGTARPALPFILLGIEPEELD